jgi:dihydroorotate dehydrogenase
MYRLLFKLALQRMDPERAHALAARSLTAVRATAAGRGLMRLLVGGPDQTLEIDALGLSFPTPLGVAAGVDKEARWFDELHALGFGFVEVGTVTAVPQEGNPRPRVARLVSDGAIVNRMGFPNPGAEAVATRLGERSGETIVGVNIGRSGSASAEGTSDDYRAAVRRLAPLADYLVLNVSSPNTPGLRELQAVPLLQDLVRDVRSELTGLACSVPLLIKIAPDLADDDIDAICEMAVDVKLDGIVAVNTTVDRGALAQSLSDAALFGGGGISGAPLRRRAVEVLRRIRANVGEQLVLISVGGIASTDDVWERIIAGASLVQVYTGFVFNGPGWPKRVNRELARRVRQAGRSSLQELIGSDADGAPQDALAAARSTRSAS